MLLIDRLSGAESDVAIYYCQGGWQESLQMSQLLELSRGTHMRSSVHNRFLFPDHHSSMEPLAGELSAMNITRGFIIAKPRRRDSKSQRRVCLIYIIFNHGPALMTGANNTISHNNTTIVSYWWTVAKTECDRNLLPGQSIILINYLTLQT